MRWATRFDVEVHPSTFLVDQIASIEITALNSNWSTDVNYVWAVSIEVPELSAGDLDMSHGWNYTFVSANSGHILLEWELQIHIGWNFTIRVKDLTNPSISWSAMVGVSSIFEWIALDFDPALETNFPGFATYKSFLWFHFGMWNFEWLVFPISTESVAVTPVEIWTEATKYCDQQIKWLYYNNVRWLRVWPLDTGSLATLKTINSSYNALQLNWWLFLNCIDENPNNIYWQIIFTLNGMEDWLTAWVEMDWDNNTYTWKFDESLIISGGRLSGFIHDSRGGIAEVMLQEPTPLIWDLSFVIWTNLKYINNTFYTKQAQIYVRLNVNKTSDITLTGNITTEYQTTLSWSTLVFPFVTTGDGAKVVRAYFDLSAEWQLDTDTETIYLDTTGPSSPVIVWPLSGSKINIAGITSFNLSWNASTDAGIWTKDYIVTLQNGSWTTLVNRNITTTSSNFLTSTYWTGKYIWFVTAYDHLGNSTISAKHSLEVGYFPDTEPNTFSFDEIDDAELNSIERSNIIIISGLWTGIQTMAELTRWVMFINWVYTGQTGMVQNWDTLWIEMASSSGYDSITSTQLKIWTKTARFVITTVSENDDENDRRLTLKEILLEQSLSSEVIRIFEELKEHYSNSPAQQQNFFYTLNSMIKDQIAFLQQAKAGTSSSDKKYKYELKIKMLKQLYSLSENYLINELGFNHTTAVSLINWATNYVAKDGKTYKIYQDSAKWWAYTAEWLDGWFPSVDTLVTYLDKSWTDDTSVNQDVMVAPNGKTYRIVFNPKTATYSSPDFAEPKSFTDKNDMLKTITVNNPTDNQRNHSSVDASRWVKYYTTQSGKKYEIRKWIKWGKTVYFSYWMVKPAYYEKIADLLKMLEVMNWWSASLITQWTIEKLLSK